jgi:N-acetylmuramoyl-L-alanine amidase
MSDSVQKSSDLASLMANRLGQSRVSDSVVKQAGFVVLKNLAMPSVLVEVGFLTNSSDVKKLATESHRQAYADCLAHALDVYFDRYSPVASVPDGQHKVAPGETLWSIARRYNMTVEDLRELNGLSSASTIRVDQVLAVKKT